MPSSRASSQSAAGTTERLTLRCLPESTTLADAPRVRDDESGVIGM